MSKVDNIEHPERRQIVFRECLACDIPKLLQDRGRELESNKDNLSFAELVELEETGTSLCRVAAEMKCFQKEEQANLLFDQSAHYSALAVGLMEKLK